MNCKDQSLALEYSEILSAEFPVVHSERLVLYKIVSTATRTNFFFPCRAILFLQVSEGLPVWNMPALFCQPQTNLTLFTMATLTQLSIPLFPW